jgi:oligopeptide transport system substrate-binding protein
LKLSKHRWYGLLLVLVLAGVLVAVAACGGDEETGTTAAGGEEAVSGGIFSYFIIEPSFIDPFNGQESEGIAVIQCVFDSLVAFDPITSALLPAAADSWEANADASVWTFHLNKDAKFHNGRGVTAADFKYAWERICNPVNESEISYHLEAVKGYEAMQEGTATELEGVKAIDDYTLEVTLAYPFGDFELFVGHPSLGPVPKEEVDKDPAAFADMPIGNGPFKMAAPWQHDQLIQIVRNDDYYGQKAYLDGVDFKIFKDEETAYLEFQAGNLDFTQVPTGQLEAAKAQYGASADGWTIEPGKQVLTGAYIGTNYAIYNTEDEFLKNADLRRALSLAVNRQAICDTVYEGARKPATGIVSEGIAGYLPDQFPYDKYDVEQAKQYLEKAGYPGGEGLPELTVIFNSGAGHEKIYALVQADWAAIGVKTKLEGIEWAQFLDTRDAGDFQISRSGWVGDYPSMDNFLYPLLQSSAADNDGKYNNPAFDALLQDARTTADTADRIAKYQEAERLAGEDAPVLALVNYAHKDVGSDRIHGFVYSVLTLGTLEKTWIEPAQ